MSSRRAFLKFAGTAALSATAAPLLARAAGAAAPDFAALEAASGGRLGVALMRSDGGIRAGHRADERFPMCSTFKYLLAAAVLARADAGRLSLDGRVPVRAADIIDHAPVTGRHVGKDVTVRDLCRATMIWSDNPAANLLLPLVGGPAGLTAFLRAHGDAVTHSDRYEPMMNRFVPGDPRDTSTPAAMAANLRRFVLGEALRPDARAQLGDWLIDNQTGDRRIRAGWPDGWRIGDKTGAATGISNDIAVLWPADGGPPWLLACYLQGSPLEAAGRDDVLRQAALLASAYLR
ncbi:class A beta-lactamase [Luteimonas sp. BDR2-5]|uniref:class A beta-lactamase n=1 Tax=Proluteimonas luteida TaxID=2878685 RepID=UPI001E3532D5|nr:class A beta-lactamase [Luteimonas sp. BDR2-5]MCD9027081.1 class A beta-lactamase [Luteimonas sp. BDR2-5]